MFLEVQCPNDSNKCLVSDGEIKESLVLLGDDEQNMQCTQCGYASNKDFKDEKELFNKFLGNINFKTNLMGLFGIIWILSISNLKYGIFGLLSVYVGYNISYCFFPKKLLEKYTKIEINSQNNLCSMEMGNIHTE